MEHTENRPTHTEIAALAEKLFLESGSLPGRDEQNWLNAEAQLNQAKAKAANDNGSTRQSKAKQSAPRQQPGNSQRSFAAAR